MLSQDLISLSESSQLLKEVVLDGCFQVTDSAMAAFVRERNSLSEFGLSFSTNINRETLQALADTQAASLLKLSLRYCVQLDSSNIGHLAKLTSLTNLDVQDCELLSDAAVG